MCACELRKKKLHWRENRKVFTISRILNSKGENFNIILSIIKSGSNSNSNDNNIKAEQANCYQQHLISSRSRSNFNSNICYQLLSTSFQICKRILLRVCWNVGKSPLNYNKFKDSLNFALSYWASLCSHFHALTLSQSIFLTGLIYKDIKVFLCLFCVHICFCCCCGLKLHGRKQNLYFCYNFY